MGKIAAMFWDVGGVLLTNAWDKTARRKLVETFPLDWDDFEDRHELVDTAFETGQISLDHYLERTIFYRPRTFTKPEIRDFMFARSQPHPESLTLLGRLAQTRNYILAALNNESRELNLFRIQRFGLRSYFVMFLSSCFLGVQKPDQAIFRLALEITQRDAQECVFIDDRALNVECARLQGIHSIQFQDVAQLEREFRVLGIEV